MTKCALFDFANTLAVLRPERLDVVSEHIERVSGIRVGREAIARAYNAIDMFMPYSSVKIYTAQQRSDFYREYNEKLLALLGVSHLVDPSGLYADFVNKKSHWVLKPHVLRVLRELRERDWKIGIISNFDRNLQQLLDEKLGLSGLVNYLHVSQAEGVEKPSIAFYKSFFERHGIDVSSSFYVGDSFLLDFLPAIKLGLRAWLLDEDSDYQYLPESISSLEELLGRLSEQAL